MGTESEHESEPGEAFEQFFRRMQPALTGQAYLLTGNLSEAHDLVQETLCRAWSNWPQVRSYEQPAAWARKVLANLAIGSWRRTRRHPHQQLSVGTAAGYDNGIVAVEVRLDVVKALGSLPMKQRQAIVLRDFVGLSLAEVASELSAPEGTVKSWLSRGRAAVASQLGLEETIERGAG